MYLDFNELHESENMMHTSENMLDTSETVPGESSNESAGLRRSIRDSHPPSWTKDYVCPSITGSNFSTAHPITNSLNYEATSSLAHLLDLPQIQQCLTSLVTVPDCVQELESTFLSGQPKLLGPTCCRVYLQIDESCWAKVFPVSHHFLSLVKAFCEAPTPPEAPSVPCTETTDPVDETPEGNVDDYD
ncbi:hypothetical protein BUALT_Bualt16G0076000 [Buddleja alternifolia]|uniref:Prolamin-like domain-containing protein n=1 Tax=Buddleja alternifolia TaxID=168488 RepID=A0AAV6WAJ4_9LAMI|nr:hypothetical protein BUALT_Bualt16G0076000 [Buddleja alternifolia]